MDLYWGAFAMSIVIALSTCVGISDGHLDSYGDCPTEVHRRIRRSAFVQLSWTRNENYGIVYVLSNAFNSHEVAVIQQAVKEISQHSCIPVGLYTYDKFERAGGSSQRLFRNYVYVTRTPKAGCHADIGMFGGSQRLNLDPMRNCALQKWTIMHEMMHSLGYDHEQNRPDRDRYVDINFQNVIQGEENNFKVKYNSKAVGPYDYYSIMHYPTAASSRYYGYPTITSKVNGYNVPNSVPSSLSPMDKQKIAYITGCKNAFATIR